MPCPRPLYPDSSYGNSCSSMRQSVRWQGSRLEKLYVALGILESSCRTWATTTTTCHLQRLEVLLLRNATGSSSLLTPFQKTESVPLNQCTEPQRSPHGRSGPANQVACLTRRPLLATAKRIPGAGTSVLGDAPSPECILVCLGWPCEAI